MIRFNTTRQSINQSTNAKGNITRVAFITKDYSTIIPNLNKANIFSQFIFKISTFKNAYYQQDQPNDTRSQQSSFLFPKQPQRERNKGGGSILVCN